MLFCKYTSGPHSTGLCAELCDRYLADGRFHLEAIMIANPNVPAFRFDPYSKKLTREWYDHEEMRSLRGKAIQNAKATIPSFVQEERRLEPPSPQNGLANGKNTELTKVTNGSSLPTCQQVWGVVLGTLGRQGSLRQMEAILRQLETFGSSSPSLDILPKQIPYMPILLSELSPAKLALFNGSSEDHGSNNQDKITTFIQTSCPRLSIDWGYAFDKPLLSPYEAAVALGRARSWEVEDPEELGGALVSPQKTKGIYPMNFYEAGSVWATSRIQGKETVWPVQVEV
jgi:2-(3-amino-3-carboxypropyl)histidine synthase